MKKIIISIIVLFLLTTYFEKTFAQQKAVKEKSKNILHDTLPKEVLDGKVIWRDSASSKVSVIHIKKFSSYETVFHNQSYLRGNTGCYGIKSPSVFLVSQNIRWSVGSHDGNIPFLTAKGYLLSNNSSSGELWSLQIEADEGRIFNDFYQIISYGCCSISECKVLFNLLNGNKILEYTEDLLDASIPNAKPMQERFIGYKSNNTLIGEDFEKYENDNLYLGTLTYASRDSTISKVILRSKISNTDIFGFGPSRIEIISSNKSDKVQNGKYLTLWSANNQNDSKLFTNFFIKIEFDEAKDSILIPIIADKISAENLETKTFIVKRIR